MNYHPRKSNASEYLKDEGSYSRRQPNDFDRFSPRTDAHLPESTHRRSLDSLDTYGTYIYEISPDDRHYSHTLDPTRCDCRCCPHPRIRRDSGSSSRKPKSWHRRDPEAHFDGLYHSECSPCPRSSSYAGFEPDYPRDYQKAAWQCREDAWDRGSRPRFRDPRREPSSSRPAKHTPFPDSRDIIIDVVDRTATQSLRARYGRRFPLAISPKTTTARDISLFLAPDQRYERVVVRWRGGELEPLDDLVPIKDLRREGTRLEVRTRKQVHWT